MKRFSPFFFSLHFETAKWGSRVYTKSPSAFLHVRLVQSVTAFYAKYVARNKPGGVCHHQYALFASLLCPYAENSFIKNSCVFFNDRSKGRTKITWIRYPFIFFLSLFSICTHTYEYKSLLSLAFSTLRPLPIENGINRE